MPRRRRSAAFLPAMALAASLALPAFAQGSGAEAPVTALDAGLAQAERNASQGFAARYALLAPVVDQAFNLPQILKTIVGLSWTSLPPAQQSELLSVFRAYTIASYAANFDSNSGDVFRLLPEHRQVGADAIEETEIAPKTGSATRIDYLVRQGPKGWQIVDVMPEGTISQVAVQRSDFRSLLSPGDASRLIVQLKKKVDTLSGGTVKP